MKYTEQDIARLASFPAQNPNPVIEVDYVTGTINYMNPAAHKRFPEMKDAAFNHPLFSEIKKRLQFKKDFQCEVSIDKHFFEQKIFFIADTHFIRVYSSDITEMKQIEKKLSRLASFPEQNPSPIIEVDMNRNITYFNPAVLIHFPDFYEKKFDHPALEGLRNNFELFKAGTLEHFSNELKYNDKCYDQRMRFMSDSNVIRMFSIDVSELKRAEEIIREKNKDIVASIHYAKRIQQSLLPTEIYIERTLKRLKKK